MQDKIVASHTVLVNMFLLTHVILYTSQLKCVLCHEINYKHRYEPHLSRHN